MTGEATREVVQSFYDAIGRGDMETAFGLLSDSVVFELPANEWNAEIPYLGTHIGREAVAEAFAVRASCTAVRDYKVTSVVAEGDTAWSTIYTEAVATETGAGFVIPDAHQMVVGEDGRISRWTVYFDPNPELAALRAGRDERLSAAVRSRDETAVARLLAAGADPDARGEDGLTALMAAAARADERLVRKLVAAGADVRTADPGAGATALHKACQGGSLGVVVALVEAGAFIDAVAPTTGHTPLMDALWFAHPDIAGYLLDRGAGIRLSTHYGFTMAEHFAYELRVNKSAGDRLRRADVLLQARQRADAQAQQDQELMSAVVADDTDRVRALLAAGAAVDERAPRVNGFDDGHTPLLVAARDGHADAVPLLLAAGADVNATEPVFGAVPLHKAVYNGHADITATLAAADGVDLDVQGATNGYTPLHDALWHGYPDCARALVDAGARTDLVGHDGRTPADVAREVLGPGHELTRRLEA